MPERCPLAGAATFSRGTPEVCRAQCEELWDKAVAENQTNGEYDIYQLPEDIDDSFFFGSCRHKDTFLQYSSDGLQSVDNSALRIYAIVDECMACEGEYGEQAYQFQCPFNEVPEN